MTAEDNERWLSDGDCNKCRRKPYCKKACTATKRALRSIISEMIRKQTGLDKIKAGLDKLEDGLDKIEDAMGAEE